MTSFNYQQADLSLNYLLSFVKGSRIEFNPEHVPENVKFTKVDPVKPIAQLTAAMYSVDFTIDLATINSTAIENVYLLVQLPAQQIVPGRGDFFAFSDLPAVKMINRIDIMFNSYENVIESLTPAVIYLRLLERYATNGSTEKWTDTANTFLGSINNSVSYTDTDRQTVLLPIPCDLFPISIDHIFKSDADRSSPVNLYMKVYFNSVDAFCVRSKTMVPNNFTGASGVCESALLLEQRMHVADPPRLAAPTALADFHVASRHSFTFTSQRGIMPKTDFVKLLDDAYINKLYMCMYNPFISSAGAESVFYGNYCYNALENYINSFLYPNNAVPPSTETILNLRDGTLINSSDIIVQLVNSSTYVVSYAAQSVTIVCANLDWQALPEDIFFDVGSLLKNTDIPVATVVKNMFFYVKPTLYEPTTPLPAVTNGAHVGLLEGLYYSADGAWAIYGFANIELRDTLTSDDMFFLKFALSRPVDASVSIKASVFATRKYCIWRDPLYMFADLDRSIKFGAGDVDVLATNRKTLDSSSTRSDWVSDAIQNYTNRMQSETAIQRYLPATFFSFSTRIDSKGYIDTVLTSYEMNYVINFFDSETNLKIVPSPARQKIINTFYGTTEIRVDYVYMLVRFLVYSAKQVYAYTVNTTLYDNIINDYYNGTLPRQIDTKMILFNQQLAEKRRKRARGVFLNM